MKWAMLLSLVAVAAAAQTVDVYSEFAQINSAGEVVAPETPREILSPAIARNAFSSFQVVVRAPQGTRFLMYIGQNPDNAVKVTLYRRTADKLEPVDLPYTGEGTQILWVDLWVDASAPVRRIKVEPQVGIHGDWITYPLEVRVTEATVPDLGRRKIGTDPPLEVLRMPLCGIIDNSLVIGDSADAPSLHFRNAQQDASLALRIPESDEDQLRKLMGGCKGEPSQDPEFYLRLRDFVFTAASKKVR